MDQSHAAKHCPLTQSRLWTVRETTYSVEEDTDHEHRTLEDKSIPITGTFFLSQATIGLTFTR